MVAFRIFLLNLVSFWLFWFADVSLVAFRIFFSVRFGFFFVPHRVVVFFFSFLRVLLLVLFGPLLVFVAVSRFLFLVLCLSCIVLVSLFVSCPVFCWCLASLCVFFLVKLRFSLVFGGMNP